MTITAEQAAKLLEGTTPGPLVVSFESVDPDWAVVTTKGGAVVANVFGQDGDNARLIAAAPDLARALIASEAARKLAEERLAALIRRAHDAIIRDEKDGAVWAQLLADMAREIDNG